GVRKRPPRKDVKKKNDVYVNRRSDFAGQLERCQKLLDSSHQEVWIHGLGAAINRAINLSLQLKQRGMGSVEVSPKTSSVQLVDDLEPENDEDERHTRTRTNSAIHIRVYRIPLNPTEQSKEAS
ncbi:predicted protein, partial [Nematostella vectensis]